MSFKLMYSGVAMSQLGNRGFPVWLSDISGIVFCTHNEPFKEEMKRFVKNIVDLIREESLLS
ncbi:putative beta-galactosidase [Helianthus annuus]|nr:putative beta-galactosidase [Helianthus annuus]